MTHPLRLCSECQFGALMYGPAGSSMRCLHVLVISDHPEALVGPRTEGADALVERSRRGSAGMCGIHGQLWAAGAGGAPGNSATDPVALRAERDRLRDRVERLRGLCMFAGVWLFEAGDAKRSAAILDLVGDMEAPVNE